MFVLSDIGDSLIFILLKPDHLFFTNNNNTGKIRLILSIKKAEQQAFGQLSAGRIVRAILSEAKALGSLR